MQTQVVGLTGGIASGKSLASDYFAQLDVPVLDADIIARELVQANSPILAEISHVFGIEILKTNGNLDRKKLGNLIFNDLKARKKLEAILHPKIYQTLWKRAENLTNVYCLFSVPLLIENRQRYLQASQKHIARVLVIDCPEFLQKQRLAKRDKLNTTMIEKRLSAQCDRQTRLAYADDIIDNQSSTNQLQKQVQVMHQFYLQKFS